MLEADPYDSEETRVKDVARVVEGGARAVSRAARASLASARDEAGAIVHEEAVGLAGTIDRWAAALARAADQLRRDRDERVASLAYRGVRALDRASRYVREESLRTAAGDLAALARRRPALVLGGLFAAGLAVGRFLRASRPGTAGGPEGHGTEERR